MENDANFLSLPVEVRLQIYAYLFQNEWVYIDSLGTPAPHYRKAQPSCESPILRTCQLIRAEASAAYFSNLKVYLDVANSARLHGLTQWLDQVGANNVRHLRHFNVRWSNYVDISIDLTQQLHTERAVQASHQALHSSQQGDQQSSALARACHVRHRSLKAPIGRPPCAPAKTPKSKLRSPTRRVTSEQETSKASKPDYATNDMYIDLLNPTYKRRRTVHLPSATMSGAKHRLSTKAVPIPQLEAHSDYWSRNGTQQFCDTLAAHLSDTLAGLLDRNGLHLTASEIINLLTEIDAHASALRWLWYW